MSISIHNVVPVFLVLFLLSGLTSSQDARTAEPKLAEASDEGQQAIAGFKLPAGWKCELFAAEPKIANPVALFVDSQGRVFVCESFRQNQGVTDNRGHNQEWLLADLAAKTVQDRIDYHKRLLPDQGKSYSEQEDRIRLLIDRDQDGKADESIVFAAGFHQIEDGTGASILVRGRDAFYTCIPKLWKLEDRNGDGVAEKRTPLADGFGVRVAFRGHDLHGLTLGPDGRLYFSIGDRGYHVETSQGILSDPASGAVFRCELDGSRLEVFATGLRNPQELAFDDYGRLFTGDNNSDSGDKARWVYVVQGGDTGWRMYYQYHKNRGPFNREQIWKPYSPETPAYIIPPIANLADGPSGLFFYPGTGLDESYRGTFFLCDFRGQASNSGVRAIQLAEKGAFFEIASNEQTIWNVLATDADFGPDGSIYLSDWVNGWNGEGKGRIYRIFDPNRQSSAEALSTKRILTEGFDQQGDDLLASLLTHPDRRVRFEAQWVLASRKSIVPLEELAKDSSKVDFLRLHGVWGLGQIARGNDASASQRAQKALQLLLDSDSSWISAIAIQMLSECGCREVDSKIVKSLSADHVQVRLQAAMAYGRLGVTEGHDVLVQQIIANNDVDPILRHSHIMAIAGEKEMARAAALKDHPSASVRLAAVIALRKRKDSRVAGFLNDFDSRVAVEAARSIHDLVELHGELPKLASILKRSGNQESLIRRSLNAHYRLGAPENAEEVASYAADSRRPIAMRLEAVEMLGEWAEPRPLDRVINDFRPLPKRNGASARDALKRHLVEIAAAPSDLRTKSLEIAAQLGILEVVPLLRKVVLDTHSPGNQRSSALEGLVRIEKKDAFDLVRKSIDDKSPAVRIAAFKLLTEIDPQEAAAAISKGTRSGIVFERQAAWDAVALLPSREAETLLAEGLRRYLDHTLPRDCRLNVLELIRNRVEGSAKADLQRFLEERAAQSEQSIVVVHADTIEGGDFEAGRDLFFNRAQLSCVRCHKVLDRGGEVGPVLTDIGSKKDAEYLLEAIVAPNAKIAEGYETTVVANEDGDVFTGILRKETDAELTLLNAEGNQVTLRKESIVARKKGLSSMPPDLLKFLTPRELRDLVAYLKGLDGKNPASLEGSIENHR